MNTCKTAFYHLQNIAKIRNCLSQDNAETLVHAFISSKLDICDALLYGLPQSVIERLRTKLRSSTGDQNSKLRTFNTTSSQTTLATSQTTNYVKNTTSYVQSTEWHGAKIYSRSPSALYSYEAITIFFKKSACNTKAPLSSRKWCYINSYIIIVIIISETVTLVYHLIHLSPNSAIHQKQQSIWHQFFKKWKVLSTTG